MNFHEYQAKELFAEYGIPVPAGQVARSGEEAVAAARTCLLYTSPSPRDLSTSRMPSSA